MSLEGALHEVSLLKVLQSVAAQRTSGILSVQGEEDIVAVSFLQGAIVAADSLNQTQEESLGAILEQQGLISQADFDAVAQEQQASGNSLIEMLTDRGLVSRQEILDGLRGTTYQLMLQLLSWRQGDFKFYGGDEISYEEGFRPLGVEELLIRSIDDLAGQGGLSGPVPELEMIFRQVPPRSEIKILGRDGDGLTPGLWISAQQAELLQATDGKTTAMSLSRNLRLSRHQAQFHLYRLLSNDLIEGVGKPAAKTAPTAQPSRPNVAAPPSGVAAAPLQGRGPNLAEPSQSHLRAEIFQPPEPEAPEVDLSDYDITPQPKPRAGGSLLRHGVGPLLAAVFLVALGLTLSLRPGALLLPFPWQENQRGTVERQLRYSLFLKIDRASRAYVLSTGAYPTSLQDLVDASLLAAADLKDPAGYDLSYSSDAISYRIDLLDDGQIVDGLGTTATMTGDFLLDDRMLRSEGDSENPLVLMTN